MIIAHRGYKKKYPENTIAAFEHAILCGAGGIETDLRLTLDGKAVISHDDAVEFGGKKVVISKTKKSGLEGFFGIDELFEFIRQKDAKFFLELKSSSPDLLEQAVKRIAKFNLWDKVSLIGFGKNISTAILAQKYSSKLMVDQIIMMPFLNMIKKPPKSRSVFFGWLDGIKYSEEIFKYLISQNNVARLKNFYESLGYNVSCGVLNREDGIRYFYNAGICDIFTDEVELAISITCAER